MTNHMTPDDVARLVTLIYGTMGDSKPFWCFVAVKPSKYAQLQKLATNKTLDIKKYEEDGFGEIVVSGEGVIPPNDVIKTVATMFNTPISKLFQDVDADAVIAREIERIKKEMGES